MPFDVSASDGVLTLTLDTAGSAVNIFNHATATQLVDIMSGVTPATTRAIVFATAKPGSFINGVGLLLAHASRTTEDVARASTPAWTAYRAVRAAPVPTIAVVQGSCFGCGVEFALNCDYRIASDSWETQFYMTELNDYLFIPVFGSTWNLPEAVGLDAAIDLLLWGERWGAETAEARGLIDEAIPQERLAEGSRSFIDRVLAGRQPSRRHGRIAWGARENEVAARARKRIAALPPQYHPVYGGALDLLEAGARQPGTYDEHRARELVASAASALSPGGKAAYAFFYLRQMASERAGGRARDDGGYLTLRLDADGADGAHAFADELRRRKLPGVTFTDGADADYRLVCTARALAAEAPTVSALPVRVALGPGPAADVELYVPARGARLLELAMRRNGETAFSDARAARLTRVLQRLGFEVARTSPVDGFVTNRLLVAYWVPLLRLVEGGTDVARLHAALRDFGFVRCPHELLAGLDRAALADLLAAALGRDAAALHPLLAAFATSRRAAGGDPVVSDALCISLLDAVLSARAQREVRDPTIADLIARELLDFPRHLCSLSTWLKTARVTRALADEERVRPLVGEAAVAAARAFVATGRELYR